MVKCFNSSRNRTEDLNCDLSILQEIKLPSNFTGINNDKTNKKMQQKS